MLYELLLKDEYFNIITENKIKNRLNLEKLKMKSPASNPAVEYTDQRASLSDKNILQKYKRISKPYENSASKPSARYSSSNNFPLSGWNTSTQVGHGYKTLSRGGASLDHLNLFGASPGFSVLEDVQLPQDVYKAPAFDSKRESLHRMPLRN